MLGFRCLVVLVLCVVRLLSVAVWESCAMGWALCRMVGWGLVCSRVLLVMGGWLFCLPVRVLSVLVWVANCIGVFRGSGLRWMRFARCWMSVWGVRCSMC